MFEINFFEKKQTNFLPYLISGVFMLLLVAVGGYFFVSYTSYIKTDEENSVWLQEAAEPLTISQQIETYDTLTKRLTGDKTVFEERQYPMDLLVKELVAIVPNQDKNISIVNVNESNQVTLVLEELSIDELSNTIDLFNDLNYVTNTHLIRIENQTTQTGSLVEMRLELDETVLREELVP